MLDITDLHVRYGPIEAVHGLDLHLAEGDFVAVLGANGAGKTSMMRGILGIADHTTGAFEFAGRSVARLSSFARIKAGISLVPEGREVFSTLTVRDNLRAAYDAKRGTSRSFAAALAEVTTLFPRLQERIGQLAGTLSGGEQQMLAIGRALVQEPRVLLLDEPSLGLAPIVIDSVMDVLVELNRRGMTILMVEQDTARALEIVSRAMVIRTGRVVAEAAPAAFADPEVLRAAVFGEGE